MAEMYLSALFPVGPLDNSAPFSLEVDPDNVGAFSPFTTYPGAGSPLGTTLLPPVGIDSSVAIKRIRCWCNFGDGLVPDQSQYNLSFLITHGQTGSVPNDRDFRFRPATLNDWVEFEKPVPIGRTDGIISAQSGIYIQPNNGGFGVDPRNIEDVFNGSLLFIRIDAHFIVGGV